MNDDTPRDIMGHPRPAPPLYDEPPSIADVAAKSAQSRVHNREVRRQAAVNIVQLTRMQNGTVGEFSVVEVNAIFNIAAILDIVAGEG